MNNKDSKQMPMDRKRFLQYSGALAAGATIGGLASCRDKKASQAVSGSSETFRWKMVTCWPKNFPGLGSGAERLAKNIETMSSGRLQIKLYAAGELVPAFEVFHTVSNGTAQMGHGAPYYWKGNVPEAQFFAAVPFGMNAAEMSGWIHHGGGQELWDETYAAHNLKPFACGNTGVQMGGWFHRPMRQLSDFKGLKIRMPGLGGEVLKKVGATVVSLPGNEIFQALQSKAIDATEWVGPYNDLAFGFHKAVKHYHWPGWHEPGTVMELMVNKKEYEKLPRDLQEIIRCACLAGYEDMLAEFQARNNAALVQLTKKHQVKLQRFSDEILIKLGKTSRGVVAELSSVSSLSKRIYQSYNNFRKATLEWSRIGENGFSMARTLSKDI